MKRIMLLITITGLSLVLGHSAMAATPELKFAVVDPAQAPTVQKAYIPWCRMVEEASGGTVKFKVYPGGTLGRDSKLQAKLVADGVADLSYINPPYSQGRFPEDEVFTLPGLSENGVEATKASHAMMAKGMLAGYEKELIGIAHYTTDVFHLHTTFPVRVPADIKGHKIRSANDFWAYVLDSIGAVPVAIPYVQAAENLSRGVIEGTINDDSAVINFRITDVAKYHTIAPLGTFPLAVVMNRAKFESLPAEAQKAIKENGLKLGLMWQEAVTAQGKELYELPAKDPKTEIIQLTPEEVQLWKDALEPALQWWSEKEPGRKELIQKYKQELELVRAEE